MFSWQNKTRKIENNFKRITENIGRRVDDLIGDSLTFQTFIFIFVRYVLSSKGEKTLFLYIDRNTFYCFSKFVCLFWWDFEECIYYNNNAVVLLIWQEIKLFDSPDIIKMILMLLFFCILKKQQKNKLFCAFYLIVKKSLVVFTV